MQLTPAAMYLNLGECALDTGKSTTPVLALVPVVATPNAAPGETSGWRDVERSMMIYVIRPGFYPPFPLFLRADYAENFG